MDDQVGLRSIGAAMAFTPCVVVMVLDVEQHVDGERFRDVRVNQFVIRRRQHARVLQLSHCVGLEIVTPNLVWRIALSRIEPAYLSSERSSGVPRLI
jgi:hypothetical protein